MRQLVFSKLQTLSGVWRTYEELALALRIAYCFLRKSEESGGKMDTAQYSRIEGGKTDPSFSAVVRIAKALGVELTELFRADELFKEVI